MSHENWRIIQTTKAEKKTRKNSTKNILYCWLCRTHYHVDSWSLFKYDWISSTFSVLFEFLFLNIIFPTHLSFLHTYILFWSVYIHLLMVLLLFLSVLSTRNKLYFFSSFLHSKCHIHSIQWHREREREKKYEIERESNIDTCCNSSVAISHLRMLLSWSTV